MPTFRVGVPTYLAIAFGLAWAPFVPLLWGGPAIPPLLMPFAPAIACVVVRRWVTREGFGDAGLRLVRGRWQTWLVALGWPLLVTPVAVVLAMSAGVGPPGLHLPWGAVDPGVGAVLSWLAFSVAAAPVLLGEELGWRGYLQDRILLGRPVPAALVTGLLWGVWHYPLLLSTASPGTDVVPMLGLFTTGTVTMSIFLGWLRSTGGTVWLPALGHATNNVTEDNLNHTSLGTSMAGPLENSASVVVLASEALVLLTVVAAGRVTERRRSARRQVAVPVL